MTLISSTSSKPRAWRSSSKGPCRRRSSSETRRRQSAILHQLLIIGEAVKRISPEFRAAHPEVPWKLIAATRDKLIYFYEGVDIEEVWKIHAQTSSPSPDDESRNLVPNITTTA